MGFKMVPDLIQRERDVSGKIGIGQEVSRQVSNRAPVAFVAFQEPSETLCWFNVLYCPFVMLDTPAALIAVLP